MLGLLMSISLIRAVLWDAQWSSTFQVTLSQGPRAIFTHKVSCCGYRFCIGHRCPWHWVEPSACSLHLVESKTRQCWKIPSRYKEVWDAMKICCENWLGTLCPTSSRGSGKIQKQLPSSTVYGTNCAVEWKQGLNVALVQVWLWFLSQP